MVKVKKTKENGIETFEAEISGENIKWDSGLTYNKHLMIEELLSVQQLVSDKPDEMLFVIVHQSMELWIKLCLHELKIAIKLLKIGDHKKARKTLNRITVIQQHMTHSWEILATLSPHDFLTFRGFLKRASGFQSYQYRELEFLLGNRNKDLIVVHKENKPVYKRLLKVLDGPSFYDETLMFLSRKGFKLPKDVLQRDWSEAYQPRNEVEDVWRCIYENTEKYWDLYMLAEQIVAIEYYFQEWRFKHMKTVSRVIGYKKGTGGSSGINYLIKALDLSFFPELWSVRTVMNPIEQGNHD